MGKSNVQAIHLFDVILGEVLRNLLEVSVCVDKRVGHIVIELTLLPYSVGEEPNSSEADHQKDDPNDNSGSVPDSLYSLDLLSSILVDEGTVIGIVQVVVVCLVNSDLMGNCRNYRNFIEVGPEERIEVHTVG